MNETEALEYVRQFRIAVQKCRSNIIEFWTGPAFDFPDDGDIQRWIDGDSAEARICNELYPWLFGEKCILRACAIVEDRGSIDAQEFYNLCWVAHRPEMFRLVGLLFTLWQADYLPEPDLSILGEWVAA